MHTLLFKKEKPQTLDGEQEAFGSVQVQGRRTEIRLAFHTNFANLLTVYIQDVFVINK